MNVEKIRIVKHGQRYKRVVIPDGWERCADVAHELVTWGGRCVWLVRDSRRVLFSEDRPIYIRRKAQP